MSGDGLPMAESSSPSDLALSTLPPSATSHRETVAVFIVDRDARIRSWSRPAEVVFGYSARDVAGSPVARLIVAGPAAAVDAAAPPDGVHHRTWFRRRDGSQFQARHVALPLQSGSGDHDSAHVVSLTADEASGPRSRRSAALRYSEAARVRLLRRLVVAQEEERRRIAADLHDHLGQQLTSLRLTFEALRRAAAPDLAVAPALAHADAILVQIDRDIDFLSWELRPAGARRPGVAGRLGISSTHGRGIPG